MPTHDVSLNSKSPFEKDCSGKLKSFADRLTAFIEGASASRPLVVALSAPYGMGKTTFVDMWRQQLLNDKKLVIKYDAWCADYSGNSLLSILAILCCESPFNYHEFQKKSIKLAKNLLPVTGKVLLNLVSRYFNLDVGPILEGLANQSELETEKVAYQAKQKAIDEFKQAIKELLSKDKKTLFFIVDELDRCKPTFALSVLEAIKHFFDIENVCFILVSHQKVLFDIFRQTYGQTFEAESYFERFIDRNIFLPSPDIDQFVKHVIETKKLPTLTLGDIFPENKDLSFPQEDMIEFTICYCCERFKLNLREIKKYLHDIEDFFVTNDQMSKKVPSVYFPAVILLLASKRKQEDAYKRVIDQGKIQEACFFSKQDDAKYLALEQSLELLLSSSSKEKLMDIAWRLKKKTKENTSPMTLEDKVDLACQAKFFHGKSSIYQLTFDFTRDGKEVLGLESYVNHLELAVNIIDLLIPANQEEELSSKAHQEVTA